MCDSSERICTASPTPTSTRHRGIAPRRIGRPFLQRDWQQCSRWHEDGEHEERHESHACASYQTPCSPLLVHREFIAVATDLVIFAADCRMQPIVHAEQVEKRFGNIHALAGVSLEIEPGIIYALLGPNGAGKTTLIRVLATLLRPDGGSATVAGIDVAHDPVAVRNRIGLAGQFAAVDEYLTGREAVEMVGRLYNLNARTARERAAEVLERFSLANDADRLVRTYSGGMKRRLDLAASLVGRPDVLFLDEPTTGIDPRSRLEVWALIRDLVGSGTTVLLTTQYLDEADQLAHRIGVINEGKLISEGTGNQLKDRLGGAVIHIDVPEDVQEATRVALGADRGAARTITLPAPEGPASLVAAVRTLDAAGITPTDIGLRRPTLDDVFVALTGHATTPTETGNGRRRGRRGRRRRAGGRP